MYHPESLSARSTLLQLESNESIFANGKDGEEELDSERNIFKNLGFHHKH